MTGRFLCVFRSHDEYTVTGQFLCVFRSHDEYTVTLGMVSNMAI